MTKIKKIIYITQENRYNDQCYTIQSYAATVKDGIAQATGNERNFCENPKHSAYWKKIHFANRRVAIQAMKRRYKKVRKLSKNELDGKLKDLKGFNDYYGPREIFVA